MRVSVLAALALSGGGSADETSSPTRSPTMSFAPTLTLSPSFAPTGVPLCEPQCEYDYHLTSERMNKKILATVYRFCWILVGMVVFSLGLSFLGHYIRHDRSHKMRVYYKVDGSDFEEDDDLDKLISEGLVEELSSKRLDRRLSALLPRVFSSPRPRRGFASSGRSDLSKGVPAAASMASGSSPASRETTAKSQPWHFHRVSGAPSEAIQNPSRSVARLLDETDTLCCPKIRPG